MDEFIQIKTGSLKPAKSYTTIDMREPVKIRFNNTERNDKVSISEEQPITIPELFNKTVLKYPEHPSIIYKDEKNLWHTITYQQYYTKVIQMAKIFIKLGLEPNSCVGILAVNCPEWFYSELGAFFVGGIVAGIYTTNSPDAVYHTLNTSMATLVIVDDKNQMEKIHKIWDSLPYLKSVIQIHGPYESYVGKQQGYYKLEDLEKLYMNADDDQQEIKEINDELRVRLKRIAPNECCCLIYTSGTVGNPKAVMLSHDTLITNAKNALKMFPNLCYGDERMVSYLPLNHIVGQIFDLFITFLMGGCIYIADKDAMKGSLLKTIAKARPTRFFGVPRVFEKIQDKLCLMEKENYGFLQMILNWAKHNSIEYHLAVMEGNSSSFCPRYWLSQNILSSIKTLFGLEKCKYFLTGGAPTSHGTKKFFLGYDIKLFEIYGLSETSGGISFGDESIKNFDAIGKPVDGVKCEIFHPNEKGYGEICIKGRNNFMGYVNEPKKTEETLDSNGWLHSGDLGYIDEQGFLYITGRIKEIVITSGGENIPPYHVENLVKSELSGLSNVMLIGDRRKYLTVLVTIKTEMNQDTESALDELHQDALDWMKSLNLKYKKLSEILRAGPCSKVSYAIAEGIKRANLNALSNAQKVQKFRILPYDFSPSTGEIGRTLKIKRDFIINKYSKLIDEMYKE